MNILSASAAAAVVLVMAAIVPGTATGAEQIEVSSTLNPVGSGARATGMGGAFISIADDATAASWNPAGLIQLERPEVSAVYSFFSRRQSSESSAHPEIETTNEMDTNGLNYGSAALPFVLFSRNMIVSINYQRLYEMDKNVQFDYTGNAGGDKVFEQIRFSQKGYLYALSPAVAVQVTPDLSVGLTLNFWGDYLGDNGWQNSQKTTATFTPSATGGLFTFRDENSLKKTVSFSGFNANLGILWSLAGKFAFGAVFKTPFSADLDQESKTVLSQQITDNTTGLVVSSSSTVESRRESLTMKMPASYGIGISYRHSDAWTVALDLYRTDWSEFVLRDSDGNETNPLDKRPISEGRLTDTTQIRFGTEYLFIRDWGVVPLRFGLFYDPEPARGNPDDFYGVSFGLGYSRRMFSVDASYQYRFGNNVTGDIPTVSGSSADVRQHTVMTSVIFYF